jgi:hypothetical protein
MMTAEKQPMINTKDAAELLGVKTSTIHRYVKDGKLEPVYKENWQIDGTKYFYLDDVKKLIELKPGITTGEAAKILSLHPTTITQYINRGLLKTEKKLYKGRELHFINSEELERFKESYETKKKWEQKEFFDKDSGYGWFQLLMKVEGEKEVGRIVFNAEDEPFLLTNMDRKINLEDIKKEGFIPLYPLSEADYIHKKGYVKFSFPYTDQISNEVYEAIDVFYRFIGPKNMKMTVHKHTILVEVKPFLIPLEYSQPISELISNNLMEGKLIQRHDGIYIDSDLETITFSLPSKLKKAIKEDSEKLNLTMEEHVLEIINLKYQDS